MDKCTVSKTSVLQRNISSFENISKGQTQYRPKATQLLREKEKIKQSQKYECAISLRAGQKD